MRAFNLIRSEPHYRRDAFDTGLRVTGYDIVHPANIGKPQAERHAGHLEPIRALAWLAQRFEAAGAAVLIAENGYLGRSENAYAKPYTTDAQEPENQLYALALNHHNGAGRWWIGEPGRWRAQGIEVKPWREDGEHVLVLPQRGSDRRGGDAAGWPESTLRRLRTLTTRSVRLRPHPRQRTRSEAATGRSRGMPGAR